jgi:hypothetical protein
VTVYVTDHHWVIERKSNFLPGCPVNVHFKAIIEKPD